MNFQHFFAMASNLNLSVESSFLIAIAVLACVLGTEIAGICILISKISHARRERFRLEQEAAEENAICDEGAGAQNFAAVALAAGAVSMTAQVALLVLAIATAVAALALVILLIVFRAQGYALISARAARSLGGAEEESVEEPVEEEIPVPVTEPVIAPVEDPYITVENEAVDQTEESFEESLEEDTVAIFDEDSVADEPVEDEPAVAAVEENEETVEAVSEEAAPVSVIRRSEPMGLGQAPGGIPVYSSAYPAGQMPVIEKYVTETYKEVIKETNTTTTTNTPATSAGEKYSPATEEILKAIAELMKLGTQLRMEKELAVEHPAVANESVPAFAESDEDEHEADEPDEDENDVEDAEDADNDEAGGESSEFEDDYESELFTGNERIVGFDEETGCYIVAHYRKSFEAKLIQARHETKQYYSEIKNALLSYEGNKDRISWTINTFTNDRTPVAKINMRARSLDLYLALDPATLEDSVYHGRDVGDKKKYADTPFLYKVNSPRKLALALELVQRTCEELGLSPIDIEPVSYEEQYPFEATEDLIRRGLIREYLREEKPAVSFELDPDHSPDLPEEDGSVIPANANFTWEFDNEQPAPEPIPETEPEMESEPVVETVAEEPASEPVVETVEEAVPASTTTTTTHETIKTTERHYTERYFGAPAAQPTTYQMLSESTQPIEGSAEIAEPEEPAESVEEFETPEEIEPIEETEESEATVEAEELEDPEDIEDAEEEITWMTLEESEEDDSAEEIEYADEAEEEYAEEEVEYADEAEEEYAEEEVEYADEAEEEYAEEEVEYVDEAEEEYAEEEVEYADEAEEEYAEEEVEYADEAEEAYAEEEVEYVDEDAEEYEDETEEVYDDEETEETEESEEVEKAPTPAAKPAASDPSVALIDVCCFDDHFENGAIVNLETLKQVGLVPESATTLKLFASGMIKGQYTVEANHFTLQALEAINANDGTSIMIR